MVRWILVATLVTVACRRPDDAPVRIAQPQVAVVDDPVVAEIDFEKLHLSQLEARLRELKGQPEWEVRALALAASDVLVVREMKVVNQAQLPTETTAQAADRFVAAVWNENRGCSLTAAELRLAYMQNLARYKHPPSWTVWQVQSRCCETPPCDVIVNEACLAVQRPKLRVLADELRVSFAKLPALGLAADATLARMADSPLRHKHLPVVEEKAAELQGSGAKVQLLRYMFWQRDVAGFEKAAFRRADPAVEAAVKPAKIGAVLGPLDGEYEVIVAVLAARQPLALGLPKDVSDSADPQVIETQRELRSQLCEQAAVLERQNYREQLLAGALLKWNEVALKGRVSEQAVRKMVEVSKK